MEPGCLDINAADIGQHSIRYRQAGATQDEYVLLVSQSLSPFTFTDPSLVPLVGYELEVAVTTDFSIGEYSTPQAAAIMDG